MSKNIVFEGWLTKSPPTKRIWRTKWRRRWFALRQSGELPGQYFLDYYADRNCRRLKGTINLDLCEQVDAGLHMERSGGIFDPKLRGSVFTIQTQSRTYHLEADCEAEMEKWVDAICRVCGLRATNDSPHTLDTYQNTLRSVAAADECNGLADTTGPYIPISECITGVRAQNIVMSTRTPYERVLDSRSNQLYTSQPHIRQNNADFSENDSNLSDDDCKSLNTSQSNIGEWSVAKSFTKLAISHRNGVSESGPPVPPRPPKTLTMGRDERGQKETYHGHPNKVLERQDLLETLVRYGQTVQWHDTPRRKSHVGPPPSPGRSLGVPSLRNTDDEEEYSPGHQSMQYCNLPCLPPAVDRALKPRRSSRSIGNISHLSRQSGLQVHRRSDTKVDGLQYLDLDLHDSNAVQSKDQEIPRSRAPVVHGKSPSATESVYKTVDFLKTEAFNITRQDAEASRSNQH